MTDPHAVGDAVSTGLSAIVHLAALTDVDACERDPQEAFRINAEGTRIVRDAASRSGARLIYVSTDYVFDGTKQGEYVEDDAPHPISHYGRSKLQGERYVREDPANLVVRSSWIIGEGRNFVVAIMQAATAESVLRVVHDQRGRPTFAGDLAEALVMLLAAPIAGCIHVAGDGPVCSRAELAQRVVDVTGLPATIEPIDSDAYARMRPPPVAPRPRNSALSLARARAARVPLRDWRSSLESYVTRRLEA